MKRIWYWLYRRFLPDYCREKLLEENRRLAEKLDKARHRVEECEAYIDGMHTSMKLLSRCPCGGREKGG